MHLNSYENKNKKLGNLYNYVKLTTPGVQNFLLRDKPLKPDLVKTSGGSCLFKILNIFPEKI